MSNYEAAIQQSRSRLQALPPDTIALRSLCPFDEQACRFLFQSLGHTIAVTYPEGIVAFADTGQRLPFDWALIAMNHLSSAKEHPLTREWVSYRALRQGRTFASNVRSGTLKRLAAHYATSDRAAVRRSLLRLGFVDGDLKADLAMCGSFAPRVPIAIQFWEGEDDLAPSSEILFNSTVAEQMHIEDIAVLCGVVKTLLLEQSGRENGLPASRA